MKGPAERSHTISRRNLLHGVS